MENRRKATNNDDNLQAEDLSDLPANIEQADKAKGGRVGGVDVLVGHGHDVVYGGAGLDILIGNTGGDR